MCPLCGYRLAAGSAQRANRTYYSRMWWLHTTVTREHLDFPGLFTDHDPTRGSVGFPTRGSGFQNLAGRCTFIRPYCKHCPIHKFPGTFYCCAPVCNTSYNTNSMYSIGVSRMMTRSAGWVFEITEVLLYDRTANIIPYEFRVQFAAVKRWPYVILRRVRDNLVHPMISSDEPLSALRDIHDGGTGSTAAVHKVGCS